MDKFHHHVHLAGVACEDVAHVRQKDLSYGASWKKRGGVGAFMMLARKWDRLENILQDDPHNYDILRAIRQQTNDLRRLDRDPGEDGSILAEVRDLRRYLLLVEAEAIAIDLEDQARVSPVMPPAELTLDVDAFLGLSGKNADEAKEEWGPVPGNGFSRAVPEGAPGPAQEPIPSPAPVRLPERPDDGTPGPSPMIQVTDPVTGEEQVLVDRNTTPPEVWGHLPRIGLELNYQEWIETPRHYRGLYDVRQYKYHLMEEYVENWGQQP